MTSKQSIPFAMDFASFLIERKKNILIRNIILFGSTARGDDTEDSDVDIFIDIEHDEDKIKEEIKKIEQSFLKSKRYLDYWRLKGIKNEIKLTIGNLDVWKELKLSILLNGLTLYGKFKEIPHNSKNMTLLFWENIKPESKRVLLSKKLFGYNQNGKFYQGLVQKYNAEKIGKGTILVFGESEQVFTKLFKDFKINVKIKKIITIG